MAIEMLIKLFFICSTELLNLLILYDFVAETYISDCLLFIV